MTREEAIEILSDRYLVMSMCPCTDTCIKNNTAIDMAISALRAQPAKDIDVPTSRWISVLDRLPEKDENYIVTVCDEGCSAGEGIWYSTVVVVAEYYKGSWTWYDGGHEYSLDGIVTHWMPMPELPETEKTEE